jgi:hypothetical protein
MTETDEQSVCYELAERHPGQYKLMDYQYHCFFCGVLCHADTPVSQLDIGDHSPDCTWRRARLAFQLQSEREEQSEKIELAIIQGSIEACTAFECPHCMWLVKTLAINGIT